MVCDIIRVMKTKSQALISEAQELFETIQMRQLLEKKEAELKKKFKAQITDGVLIAADIVISIEDKFRTSLDREAMEISLGLDTVKQFEKVTQYQQVNVKKVGG